MQTIVYIYPSRYQLWSSDEDPSLATIYCTQLCVIVGFDHSETRSILPPASFTT